MVKSRVQSPVGGFIEVDYIVFFVFWVLNPFKVPPKDMVLLNLMADSIFYFLTEVEPLPPRVNDLGFFFR